MSVKRLGVQFCTALHREELKTLGYRKVGSTFSCERAGYTEYINIQGSSWNSGSEPWQFYVNLRVRLHGIPTPLEGRANYHADGRLGKIVPSAPSSFELSESNLHALVKEIAGYLRNASESIPELLAQVRPRAEQGWASPLPVPASWLKQE